MEINCSAIMLILCVGGFPLGDVEINVSNHGFGLYASVQADDWHADYNPGGDVVPPPLIQERLSRACVDTFCVGYHRYCDDVEHPTACTYILDVNGSGRQSVAIASDDEAGLRTAMQHIGIVIDAATHRGMALSLLEDESPYRSQEEIFCLQPDDTRSVEGGC